MSDFICKIAYERLIYSRVLEDILMCDMKIQMKRISYSIFDGESWIYLKCSRKKDFIKEISTFSYKKKKACTRCFFANFVFCCIENLVNFVPEFNLRTFKNIWQYNSKKWRNSETSTCTPYPLIEFFFKLLLYYTFLISLWEIRNVTGW